MSSRIAQHEIDTATRNCIHCGCMEVEMVNMGCVFRDPPPRPVPTSIFNDLGAHEANPRRGARAASMSQRGKRGPYAVRRIPDWTGEEGAEALLVTLRMKNPRAKFWIERHMDHDGVVCSIRSDLRVAVQSSPG